MSGEGNKPVTTKLPSLLERPEDTGGLGHACRVVLINCDCHTFDEVERQLIKAVRCTLSRARALAWEVHATGSATVYAGHVERCEAVAAVLEDIRLVVQVVR